MNVRCFVFAEFRRNSSVAPSSSFFFIQNSPIECATSICLLTILLDCSISTPSQNPSRIRHQLSRSPILQPPQQLNSKHSAVSTMGQVSPKMEGKAPPRSQTQKFKPQRCRCHQMTWRAARRLSHKKTKQLHSFKPGPIRP